jgi:fluoride exporter
MASVKLYLPIWKLDVLYLIVGAVAGAYLRYKIGSEAFYIYGIPVTILLINVLGSFILGLSMTTIAKLGLSQSYVVLVGIGFCGSFTTMSSFAFEATNLLDGGKLAIGMADISLNVGLSLGAIVAGRELVFLLAGI